MIVLRQQSNRVVLKPTPQTRLSVAAVGPQGPSGSDWHTFVFSQPSLVWRITHNRTGCRYITTVRSSSGELQIVSATKINDNEFIIQFDEPMAGSVEVLFEVKSR